VVGVGVVTEVSMLQAAPVQPSSQMHVPSVPLQRPLPLHVVNILHCLMHSLEYMFSSHAWQPTPERPSSGQPAPSGVVCGAVVVGVVLKVVVGAGVVLEVLVGEGVVLEVVGAGLVVVPDKVVSATVVVVLQDVVCAGFVVAVVRVSVVVVGDGVARELFADVCYAHTNDDDDCLVQAYS
jgi:hypothetical protein